MVFCVSSFGVGFRRYGARRGEVVPVPTVGYGSRHGMIAPTRFIRHLTKSPHQIFNTPSSSVVHPKKAQKKFQKRVATRMGTVPRLRPSPSERQRTRPRRPVALTRSPVLRPPPMRQNRPSSRSSLSALVGPDAETTRHRPLRRRMRPFPRSSPPYFAPATAPFLTGGFLLGSQPASAARHYG